MEDAIVLKNITKKYGQMDALTDLSLQIKKGEVFGYLGPNGAGKTTTIRILLGLIKPTSGSATVCGFDSQTQKMELHKHITYVPGESMLWSALSGKQILHLLGNIHGNVDNAYRDELIKKFQFDPDKRVRAYSKGNKQKITLIAALATRADVLLLDEPTSGLDPVMEQIFRGEIQTAKERGQTVFLSSHILEEVQALCDRIGILRSGKLIDTGTLAQLRHLSALRIDATFASAPPDVSAIAGVSNIEVHDTMLSCNMHGDIAPLLTIIANAQPLSFISSEPSLEELFMTIYGSTSA